MKWKHAVAVVAVLMSLAVCSAQGQLLDGSGIHVDGYVLVETEDGTRKPVPNALIEIYSEQGNYWALRTDQNGHYNLELIKRSVRGLPSWLVVVSGPGLMPMWDYNAHFDHTPAMDFVTYPGPGNRLSREDVQKLRAKGRSPAIWQPGVERGHYTVTLHLPEEGRAEYFGAEGERSAAVRKLNGLMAESEAAKNSYDDAVWHKTAGDYSGSMDAFSKLVDLYGKTTDPYFAKLVRFCLANIAEAHFLLAQRLYEKGNVEEAKDHFEKAVNFGYGYLDSLAQVAEMDEESQNLAIISNRIIATSSLDLMKFLHMTEYQKTALEAADHGAAIDAPARKADWELLKARAIAASGQREAAIANYKTVISLDPNNADALYEISLLLIKSDSQQDVQEAKTYLKKFVSVAPDADERQAAAKQAIQTLEPDNPGALADARPGTQQAAQPSVGTAIQAKAQQASTDAVSAAATGSPKEAPGLHKADTAELDYREDPSGEAPSDKHAADKAAADKAAADVEAPIKLEARLVNLNISAVNHAGVAVPNLTKEDFSVFENGVKQYITFFEKNDSPVNLMLLLDLSSSARDKIELIKAAASRFISLLPPGDRIGVAAFTRRYYPISDFTSDHALLQNRIKHTTNLEGGTAFYDAMWTAMAGLDRSGVSRKALVVLTDGVDENLLDSSLHPSKHTFEEMLDRVSEDDVTVYPIYLDTEREETHRVVRLLGPGAGDSEHAAYNTARSQLNKVADSTGGTLFKAAVVEDLDGTYQKVADELHSLYSLAYAPKELKNNGRWRKIHVKTGRKDVVLRTRRGVYDK
ncbi:MAG TPA: VWA domain-containing protein [Blastocatellia bacterium]